jgi:hypothetical protein
MVEGGDGDKRKGAVAALVLSVLAAIWVGVEEIGHVATIVWIAVRAESWVPSTTSSLGPQASIGVGIAVALGVMWFLGARWQDVPNALRGTGSMLVVGAGVLALYAALHMHPSPVSSAQIDTRGPSNPAPERHEHVRPPRAGRSAARRAHTSSSSGRTHPASSKHAAVSSHRTSSASTDHPTNDSEVKSSLSQGDGSTTAPTKPKYTPVDAHTPVEIQSSKASPVVPAKAQPEIKSERERGSGIEVTGN